jgi:hypothetical protein
MKMAALNIERNGCGGDWHMTSELVTRIVCKLEEMSPKEHW